MICSSVNLDCFIRPSLRWAGLSLPVEEFQGVTSSTLTIAVNVDCATLGAQVAEREFSAAIVRSTGGLLCVVSKLPDRCTSAHLLS